MFSGLRKLGESQEMEEDVQDVDEGSDIDFITTNYMSPDSGYPAQRINDYDTQLVQHQTLNGVGQSRMAAPFLRNFVSTIMQPRAGVQFGVPRGDGGAEALTPRTSPLRGFWGMMPDVRRLMELQKPVGWAGRIAQTVRAVRAAAPPPAVQPRGTWAMKAFRATAR